LKRHKLSRVYKDVFIGTEAKIPVRLVIELMPDAVYEQRMRKTLKIHKKKGYQTSEEYKFMSRFNLFITNVPKETLPDEVVSVLYRMRWQIELIFKIWKSIFGIHLFTSCQVNLQTPIRANQEKQPYPAIFKRMRKRIETLFAQLCDQFMLRRNYAKTIMGLSVRILSKITAVTLLQYINSKNNKPINHLKYALAS